MGSVGSGLRKNRVSQISIKETIDNRQLLRRNDLDLDRNDLELEHKVTFPTQMLCWDSTRFCILATGDIAMYGVCEVGESLQNCIHIYSCHGDLLNRIPPPSCDHDDGCHDIKEIVTNGNTYLAVSCADKDCKAITLCEIKQNDVMKSSDVTNENNAGNDVIVALKGPKRGFPAPGAMCSGDNDTIYSVQCIQGSYAVCALGCAVTPFCVTEVLPLEVDVPCYICHVARQGAPGVLVVTKWLRQTIAATCLVTRKPLWRLKGEIDGIAIEPHGLCSDGRGRVFVADGSNRRILVINSYNGALLWIISVANQGDIYEIGYSKHDTHLIVQHSRSTSDNEHISVFNLVEH